MEKNKNQDSYFINDLKKKKKLINCVKFTNESEIFLSKISLIIYLKTVKNNLNVLGFVFSIYNLF